MELQQRGLHDGNDARDLRDGVVHEQRDGGHERASRSAQIACLRCFQSALAVFGEDQADRINSELRRQRYVFGARHAAELDARRHSVTAAGSFHSAG
jgi:hypothetical protein